MGTDGSTGDYSFLYLFGALLLVLLNGFFVAAEFAIVKVRSTRIQQLVEQGDKRARMAQKVIGQLDGHLSATQLGITIASILLGWLGEPALVHLFEPPLSALVGLGMPASWSHPIAVALGIGIITMAHVVVGEVAPKSLAIFRPEPVALWVAYPLNLFYRIFYGPIWLLNAIAAVFLRMFHVDPRELHEEAAHTDEELRMLVSASAKGGYLDETERTLLDNVIDFSDRVAREIMVPRGEMVCLYVEDPMEESLRIAKTEGHTRFPLCEEDKDHIIGLVHIKDLFARGDDIKDLRELVRPVLMVPETVSISTLLKEFQKQRSQMAILVDEYGGTAGLVTVEDVLEEIVGDIVDEFDPEEEPEVEAVAPNIYEVDGAMLLEEVEEQLGFQVDEDPEVDTIGGYIFTLLGRQPEVGDKVDLHRYEAEVTETEGFRITRVRLTRRTHGSEQSGGDGGGSESSGLAQISPAQEA